MKLELNSIQKNKTWKLIDLPEGKKPIIAKCVFKVTPNLDRKLEKLALLPMNMNNMKA
jgi:hypothetical protein